MSEIQQASIDTERPIEQEITDEVTPTAATEAGEGEQSGANEGESEHKRRSGYQRQKAKIDRMSQELDFWREEALRNRTAKPEEKQAKEDAPPPKPTRPKVSEFQNYADYETALEKYEVERDAYHEANVSYQVKQARAQVKEESQREASAQDTANSWAEKVNEAREQHPDFMEVAFQDDVPMSQAMMEAIVTSELGAEVAYELGKNPDEAERISKLSPVAAVREIGKIEARIAGKTPAAEAVEPPAAISKAPKPPSPVRRATGSSTEPEDGDDWKTWVRKREAQLQRK